MPKIKVGPVPLSLLAGPPCPRGPGCVVMVAVEGRPAWPPGKAPSVGPSLFWGCQGMQLWIQPTSTGHLCLSWSVTLVLCPQTLQGLDTEVTNVRLWAEVHVAPINSESQGWPIIHGDGRQLFLLQQESALPLAVQTGLGRNQLA